MLDTKRQRKYAGSQPVLCKAFYIKIAPALYLHFIFYIGERLTQPPIEISPLLAHLSDIAARLRAALRASKGGCI